MYFISEGLGRSWKPLAFFFAACGMFGCLPFAIQPAYANRSIDVS